MDEKTRNQDNPAGSAEPETRSAFPRREASHQPAPESEEKPIPSQPRSFSPIRPQRSSTPPRKPLTTPAIAPATSEKSETAADASARDAGPTVPVAPASLPPREQPKPAVTPQTGELPRPAQPKNFSSFKSRKTAESTPDTGSSPSASSGKFAGAATAASAAAAPKPGPQSSGAGGDTIRMRVSPRPHARTLNTAPGRGLRRRLPDIRQGRATTPSVHYGAFSLFFGFLWLIFKMVFFTGLMLGLGALIGFMVMTEYIKTPEVTVPNVSGMKIEEAFTVLSDKNLGVIKRGTESSGLVAPGEIISQQPPAGSAAKVDTDVGVVISSGRSQFVVPNVVNETKENAINKIRGARLEVGNALTLEDNSVPRGNVISQTPIGGTGSDEVIKVDLMISAGPPGKSLTMPDLAGRSVLEARAALKAVGIEDVVTEPEDAAPDAVIKNHSPLVGKTVFQTDKIILTTADD